MIITGVHITSDQQIFWQYSFVKLALRRNL
jgi:hypothetical protein